MLTARGTCLPSVGGCLSAAADGPQGVGWGQQGLLETVGLPPTWVQALQSPGCLYWPARNTGSVASQPMRKLQSQSGDKGSSSWQVRGGSRAKAGQQHRRYAHGREETDALPMGHAGNRVGGRRGGLVYNQNLKNYCPRVPPPAQS